MARIRWAAEAETWLKDIYDYIATNNPDGAIRVVDGIYEKTQVLKKFPDIGYMRHSEAEGEVWISFMVITASLT